MAAKNIDVLDGADDDSLAAISFAGGSQDWVFSCGVCHVGGGQLEFDRDRNPVTSASPDGDYYQFFYPSQDDPDPTGVQPGSMVTATEYAETDCMMCHAGKSKTANVVYQTMGCDETNPIGPMNDRNCDGVQDNPMFGMVGALTVTTPEIGEYDMYNRNHAVKRHKLSLAPSMGLGALGVNTSHTPAGNDAATSDDSNVTPLATVDWGTATPSIAGANIKYAPDSQNCTVCHGRDDNTLGLPGMVQMKTGFGNYFAMEGPGSGYNNANDHTGTLATTSDNWDFELGCKPGMGKRGHRVGHGPHDKWGMSMLADQFGLTTDGNPPAPDGSNSLIGTPIVDQEFLGGAIVVKEDIPDADVHDIAMVNDGSGAREMRCSDCHYMFGKDNVVDPDRGSITGDGVYLNNAGEFRGVHYPAHEIHAMDHQFGTGNSMPDNNSMDYLDDTVTCQSCHDADGNHPKLTRNGGYLDAPVPLHNGLPPLHLERIGCETCHNPAIYAAPGKKKYRDWSVGFYKNSYYRNMLDWNFDLITGSYKPTQPSHMWMTKNGETKIYPFFPSFDPMWMDDLTITEEVDGSDVTDVFRCGSNSEIPCSGIGAAGDAECVAAGLEGEEAICEEVTPVPHSVSTQSMMKNRIMNRAGEYFEEQYIAGNIPNYVRRNEGYVAPLFDGFSLADAMVIDTKADIDYMLDTAFPAVATADEPVQAGTYKMYQKTFDVTHGTVPKEWALGSEKRGGCINCHSSADPRDPNYSPYSAGFFEGINQPHHYAGKVDQPPELDWLEGQGVGGVDYVKNWFSAFADFDCTALCNPEAAMSGTLGTADAAYFDQTANGSVISGAACTSSSMFSNSPMTQTTGACIDTNADGVGDTCSNDPYGMGAPACDPANDYDHPMAPGMNHDCDMNGIIDMCTGMMSPAFDTMMGFPPGAAAQMGMVDGIAGLQAFVVKEGYNIGYGLCNPMGGVTSAALLQGIAGTVNMCMPNYADAGVAAAIPGAAGYAAMINGTCAGADMNTNPPTPGACSGGFRNTGYCYADVDCEGAMTDLNEISRNPMGRINTRDQVRKAYKVQLQQSIVDGRKRLDWTIAAKDRNGVPYSWNQADICIDPMQSNLMQTVEVPCTDGGFVQTVVHANQFLGYSDTMLNLLKTPQQSSSAGLVVAANFSALASMDTDNQVEFRTDDTWWDSAATAWTTPTTVLSACYEKKLDGQGIMYTEEKTCTYSWDFSDGSGAVVPGGNGDTFMMVTYPAVGTYTATLTMCMADEPSVCDTQSVEVTTREVEPPAPATPVFGTDIVGNTLTLTSDLSGFARLTVYWGDRKQTAYTSSVDMVHTYSGSGTYDLRVDTLDAQWNKQSYTLSVTIP